jgi:CHRD domain
MQQLRIASVAIAVLFLSAAYAGAAESSDQRTHFKADLRGFQENPSISTTGHGHVDIRINDDAQTIDFELSYEDLEGVGTTPFVTNGIVRFAHIHVSAPGVNGGVAVFFCGGGGKPDCPTPSGTVTGTIAAADIVGPGTPPGDQGINPGEPTAFAELVRAIRAGFAYANVHTTRWGSGEIRGQLRPHEKN